MTQYQYPFPLDTITTDFGAVDSEHPNPHRGTDFAPGGLPIPAVSDGVVVRDERQSGLGNVVTVRADDGIFWACSHMADRTPFNVGDRVARGDTVGVVGNTGSLTTGRHLHFTMSPSSDDPASGPVFDSVPYITARLTSSAGGSTTPFPSDQVSQEDDMPYIAVNSSTLNSAGNRDDKTVYALIGLAPGGGPGNVIETTGDSYITWVKQGVPTIDLNSKQYAATVSAARGVAAVGDVQIDYVKLAAALPKLPTTAEIATAVNTDAAKRLSA